MASKYTFGIPYISEIIKPSGSEHYHILGKTGDIANLVLRKSNGSGIYLGLVNMGRNPAETGSTLSGQQAHSTPGDMSLPPVST